MKWMERLNENMKKTVRSWLNVQPANPFNFQINEMMDFEGYAILNRIWYRGDGNELEQIYQQNAEIADKYKFWASKSTPGMEMRKIHIGLPGATVRALSSAVLPDMNDFEFKQPAQEQLWKKIAKDNKFHKKIKSALKETLYIGDGAFKVAIDTSISEYPILEWYPGDRVEFVYQRDRLRELVFKTPYKEKGKTYVLNERYGYGYIINELYLGNKLIDIKTIRTTENLVNIEFDKSVMLAVPLMIYESAKYEGRGGSIFDGKLDSYDSLDETWSQWMDALRAGRAKTYIPECLIPHDPETGTLVTPNPFDNRYFASDGDMREGQKNQVITDQPTIPHDSYMASYITALDLCLQGVISPSTLGIDTKKLDNAEAQREKEKTTLYTRNAIVEALQETLPEVVAMCINANNILHNQAIEEVEVNVPFGEYANPSFESQVETVAKAKQGGIMSIERCVEELYGDTLDEHCKEEEIARLKAEQGIQDMEEPAVNMDAGNFRVDLEGGEGDEGKGRTKNVPDEPEGVPGTAQNSKGAGTNGNLRSGES
ncbi:capsid protein [Blautia sp. MSJ-19]|uniref:capsid protein n=1 Tax=Blautia sp. MSJ-19 TaxID=2841517 RepID=UPI001C0ECF12|nr:capsid protein [Blautia sp. MSJ-19]